MGEYAASPYLFQNLGIKVFCMEELCYALKENAFLLDAQIMSDTLLDWIDKECGLSTLAVLLYPMVHQKGSLSAFVTAILKYAGFYDGDAVSEVEAALKKGAGLSIFEKRKTRLDYLVEKKKYVTAVHGYEELLEEWKPGEEAAAGTEIRARILHNKGVALTGLMRYNEAAADFHEAYELDQSEESFICFLAAKRMELPEAEYVALAAELSDRYQISLKLEQLMERLNLNWQEDAECMRLKQRVQLRQNGVKQKYYEDNDRLTFALKESYRISVSE